MGVAGMGSSDFFLRGFVHAQTTRAAGHPTPTTSTTAASSAHTPREHHTYKPTDLLTYIHTYIRVNAHVISVDTADVALRS